MCSPCSPARARRYRAAATGGVILALEAGLEGVAGAFGQLKDAVKLAADLEQTTIAFEVMLKSANAAKEMIGDIRKFAATTPFNNKELTDSARQLLAYGVAADQVIPTVKMLGDVSAAFGKDLKIDRLAFLYGTAFAQERLFTKDMNQFAQAGMYRKENAAHWPRECRVSSGIRISCRSRSFVRFANIPTVPGASYA